MRTRPLFQLLKKKRMLSLGGLAVILLGIILISQQFSIFASSQISQYTLFSRSALEPIYSDTIPRPEEIIPPNGELEAFAALGETEPVTFSVRPNSDLGSVAIDLSDLRSSNGVLSKNNIDLYNVKIWDQCVADSTKGDWFANCGAPLVTPTATSTASPLTQKVAVPELLVKDNEQDLKTEEVGWVPSSPTPSSTPTQFGRYSGPHANEVFKANIKQGQTHTFYLSIKVPEDTAPGTYSGTVKFAPASNQGWLGQEFNLKITVLPFELSEPDKDISLHLTQGLNDEGEQKFNDISPDKYKQYLDLVREAGVTNLNLHFTEKDVEATEKLAWLADEIKARDFRATFILYAGAPDPKKADYQAKLEELKASLTRNIPLLKSKGFDVFVYGRDEPYRVKEGDGYDYSKIENHVRMSEIIHKLGGKVTTSIKKECADDLLNPANVAYIGSGVKQIEKIDLPIYKIGEYSNEGCTGQSITDYISGLQSGALRKNPEKEYYYFQIWPEQPPVEKFEWTNYSYIRNMTGFFLFESGLDGISPYGLDSVFSTKGRKEYDDYDHSWEKDKPTQKDLRAIYRTEQGFLKTLQFEAFREGIDDIKYATTFYELADKLSRTDKKNEAERIKQKVNERLSNYSVRENEVSPWVRILSQDHQANRKFVADMIVELQKISYRESEFDFPKGFTVFGTTSNFSSSLITSRDLIVYRYNGESGAWESTRSFGDFEIEPHRGYLVHNFNQNLTIKLPYNSDNISNQFTLTRGWNMLFNSTMKTRNDVNLELNVNQIDNINNLVTLGRVEPNIFVIEDEKAGDVCRYVSLLGSNTENIRCSESDLLKSTDSLKPGKVFWIRVK